MFTVEHRQALERDVWQASRKRCFFMRYLAMVKQEQTCESKPLAIQAREVGRLLGVSLRQVWRLNSTGKLPKPVRLGGSVRWRRDEIIAWLGQSCPDRQTWDAIKETLAGGAKCSMNNGIA